MLISTHQVWAAEEGSCHHARCCRLATLVSIQSPNPTLRVPSQRSHHSSVSQPFTLCVTRRGWGPPWQPTHPLPAGDTEAVGQELACPRHPVPGLGRANRILGTGWQCCSLPAGERCSLLGVQLCCCFAPQLWLPGGCARVPTGGTPHLGAAERGSCCSHSVPSAVCGRAGTESSLALAPCPLPCPFPEAAACGHGLAAVPAAGWAGAGPCPLGHLRAALQHAGPPLP